MKTIIHRGITSIKGEENSYIAIKKALRDKNSYGVEFDVRLTKDKKIVLSHNSLVKTKIIEKTEYLEIIKEKYLDTLNKILTIDTDKIILIDIKVNGNYKNFGNLLLKELEGRQKNIYLASFNKQIINYLKKKKKFKVGLISFYPIKNKNVFNVINYHFLNKKKIKKMGKKEIFLWTIDNKQELMKITNEYQEFSNVYAIIDKSK